MDRYVVEAVHIYPATDVVSRCKAAIREKDVTNKGWKLSIGTARDVPSVEEILLIQALKSLLVQVKY